MGRKRLLFPQDHLILRVIPGETLYRTRTCNRTVQWSEPGFSSGIQYCDVEIKNLRVKVRGIKYSTVSRPFIIGLLDQF